MSEAESYSNPLEAYLVEQAQGYVRELSRQRPPDAQVTQAWDEFYEACAASIHQYVAAMGVPADEREDCVQEVWVHLVRYMQQLKYDPQRGRFRTWLYALTRSASVDAFRRRRRDQARLDQAARLAVLHGNQNDPASALEASELRARTEQVLETARKKFSQTNFALFQMRFIEQRSVEEVARALDLTPRQVWFRQHRIKKKLQSLLPSESGPVG